MSKHPIQPLMVDAQGILRFKENAIVRYLLDNGGLDLNHLAREEFPLDDREQFYQLIGYSLSGFGEIGFVTDETYESAERMHLTGESDNVARVAVLEGMLHELRQGLLDPIARLYGKHPDDLIREDD